jgi:hypothetical protein
MTAIMANDNNGKRQQKGRCMMKSRMVVPGYLVLVLALLISLSGCGQDTPGGNATGNDGGGAAATTPPSSTSTNRAAVTPAGSDIVIPLADVTEQVRFYPTAVDDTVIEVLAVKAPDGTIRTAFNTCQVCYDSGRGYYEQEGNVLVCQNCGNRFAMDDVEIKTGGCNPVPIFEEDKTITDESIVIPANYLKQAKAIFANWKQDYR